VALGKRIITSIGIPASFWVIPKIELDYYAKQGLITIYGYADKEHSNVEQGKFLERLFINIYPNNYVFDKYFDLSILKQENVTQLDMAYKYVKDNIEVFKDAEDIIEVV
jgi:hypothetical protein